MDKFRHKLPKEELKKLAREINKKLVASDYKNNRVDDPYYISNKQERKIKSYVKDYFDRVVQKYQEREKKKAERAARHSANGARGEENSSRPGVEEAPAKDEGDAGPDDEVMSDDEPASPASSDRKRKREEDEAEPSPSLTPDETPSIKRLKEDEVDAASPPPPPPPPPPEGAMDAELTEEERCMREQEEALMRENEEAQRLEDEAERRKLREDEEALRHENDEAMRDLAHSRKLQGLAISSNSGISVDMDNTVVGGGGSGGMLGGGIPTELDGQGPATVVDRDSAAALNRDKGPPKTEVLGH